LELARLIVQRKAQNNTCKGWGEGSGLGWTRDGVRETV